MKYKEKIKQAIKKNKRININEINNQLLMETSAFKQEGEITWNQPIWQINKIIKNQVIKTDQRILNDYEKLERLMLDRINYNIFILWQRLSK